MTAREWMMKNMPVNVSDDFVGGVFGCPSTCPDLPGDLEVPEWCCCDDVTWTCATCWDRELPEVDEIVSFETKGNGQLFVRKSAVIAVEDNDYELKLTLNAATFVIYGSLGDALTKLGWEKQSMEASEHE